MWVRQKVVICKIDDGIRWMSIEIVIENYLLYNVLHVSAFIMGHSSARWKIFNNIAIAHNTFLLNWLISQHYIINKCFIDYGRNYKI